MLREVGGGRDPERVTTPFWCPGGSLLTGVNPGAVIARGALYVCMFRSKGEVRRERNTPIGRCCSGGGGCRFLLYLLEEQKKLIWHVPFRFFRFGLFKEGIEWCRLDRLEPETHVIIILPPSRKVFFPFRLVKRALRGGQESTSKQPNHHFLRGRQRAGC